MPTSSKKTIKSPSKKKSTEKKAITKSSKKVDMKKRQPTIVKEAPIKKREQLSSNKACTVFSYYWMLNGQNYEKGQKR